MKKLILLFSVILLLSNCKDPIVDGCEGPDCPLSDGTNCPGDMLNVNDQCVCPEGSIELDYGLCWSREDWDTNDYFFFDFDCECLTGNLLLAISATDPISGIYTLDESYAPSGDTRIGGPINFLPGSTRSNFNGQLYPGSCGGGYFYVHGNMTNDTLNYELYFLNASNLDTCGPFVAYPID